jgi:cyanophycinase
MLHRDNKRKKAGPLIIIGGHEDREGDKKILQEVAKMLGDGRLVIADLASQDPEGLFETYEHAFRKLGVAHISRLYVNTRQEAQEPATLRLLKDATGVFFTGGDQLRIASLIGDSATYRRIQEIYGEGGVIAGSSAGASVMCETMLVAGSSDTSCCLSDLRLGPGLGFMKNTIIDQHFAERGRIGRLLGAVAQNPKILGIGIDEDTAIIVEKNIFRVVGEGAVYVADGKEVSYSNSSENEPDCVLSVFNTKLHILNEGCSFNMIERTPILKEKEDHHKQRSSRKVFFQ